MCSCQPCSCCSPLFHAYLHRKELQSYVTYQSITNILQHHSFQQVSISRRRGLLLRPERLTVPDKEGDGTPVLPLLD